MIESNIEPNKSAWRSLYQPEVEETAAKPGKDAAELCEKIRQTTDDALDAVEKVRGDSRFSDEHKADEERKIRSGATELVHEIAGDLGAELEDLRAAHQTERDKLSPADPIEPADAAGAIADMELRAALRAMDSVDRTRFVQTQAGARELAAVLRAEPWLSGLDPAVHEGLKGRAIQVRHPEKLKDLEAAERNIKAAERARDNAYKLLTES